jgi:hypothetical protein
MTSTIQMITKTQTSTLTEEALSLADDIRLSDLLDNTTLSDLTIRFICGARKAMLENAAAGADLELENLISRLYHRIGHERRSTAFANYQARTELERQSTKAPALVTRPVAPDFTSDNALEKARNVITCWFRNAEPKRSFTFEELKRAVANIHTSKGERDWSAVDLEKVSSGVPRWEQTLQGALRKLRDLDEIHYRSTKSDYFILG